MTHQVSIDLSDFKLRVSGGNGDILLVTIERTTSTDNIAGYVLSPDYYK